MIRHSLQAALVAVAAIVSSSSLALAAPTAWDVPSGDNGAYTYTDGQTLENRFGSGMTFGNGFFFVPMDLKAEAIANGSSRGASIGLDGHEDVSDTLSVILNAKPNVSFTRISSAVLGDYSIFGAGTVNATGALRVTNLDTAATLTSPLAFGNTVPATAVDGSGDGIFNGLAAISLPAGWTNIRVEMDGFLSADALAGSALIQGKDAEVAVETSEIPIPAAFAVAPVMAAIGWRARRKLGLAR